MKETISQESIDAIAKMVNAGLASKTPDWSSIIKNAIAQVAPKK